MEFSSQHKKRYFVQTLYLLYTCCLPPGLYYIPPAQKEIENPSGDFQENKSENENDLFGILKETPPKVKT